MLPVVPGTVFARANWGRWIADCPRAPHCRNAETLGRFSPVINCANCGARAEVVWPPDDVVYSIERLLLMRPDETTQNWEPGETLTDLMWENGAHGIFTGVPGELIVDGGGIRMDSLPANRKPELKAITR